jgi:membrane protease YdiL (CAAX protease family)
MDAERPLWRRIVDFPLVAMVICVFLYIVALVIGGVTGEKLLRPVLHSDILTLAARDGLIILLMLLAYKMMMVRLGQRPRDDLKSPRALPQLGAGIGLGALLMVLAAGAAAVAGVYKITGQGDASYLVHELVAAAIFPAFTEELLFRGILFRWLEEFAGSWAALLLTSAFFGAAHLMNPNASWVAAFGIAIEAGVLLGGAYMLTRNLWLAMGIHAGWNFTQGEILDIPVSGLPEHGLVQSTLTGAPLLSGNGFGLEASLFAMVIATLAGVWLVWKAVKKGEAVGPMWSRRRTVSPQPAAA